MTENIDNKKRNEILHECYETCKKMSFVGDTVDLYETIEDKEELDFITALADHFIQQRQKKVIAEKRF